jgi:hypothetical protein
MRTCHRCGGTIQSTNARHRLCWRCWRSDRDEDLRTEGWTRGYQAGRREAGPALDPELLRLAVTLTHPDRHPTERADVANRVTAWLLGLLAAHKAAA